MSAGRSAATPGPVLFARFAYPPNALGYCGPGDSRAVLEYAAAGVSDRGLVTLARAFDGAWPYLALIAAATGRRDPLDPDVVAAYWIGSDLLERVPPALLAAHVDDRFARRVGRRASDLGLLAALGGRAHHNFHVFAVYPWAGLLRGGHTPQPLRVLDSCRIRWGQVQAVHGQSATVRSRTLVWDGRALRLGAPICQPARLAVDGHPLAPRVEVGDWVALHWDWVCQRLDAAALGSLRHYTRTQLALANHALDNPVPGRAFEAV